MFVVPDFGGGFVGCALGQAARRWTTQMVRDRFVVPLRVKF